MNKSFAQILDEFTTNNFTLEYGIDEDYFIEDEVIYVKILDNYWISHSGKVMKYTRKELSPTIGKSKNYIFYQFIIKVNGEKYTFLLHKLMMQHFNLTKQQCIEQGYLHKYDPVLYESLRKKDSAKNKKLPEQERINRLNDWCNRFVNRFDMVHNENRKQELYRYCYTQKSTYLYNIFKEEGRKNEFVHYVPDKNNLNKMIQKLMNDQALKDYYFNTYLQQNQLNCLYFTEEDYLEYLEQVKIKENTYRKNKEYLEGVKAKQKEEEIVIETNTEQFDRCDSAIRICSQYADSLDALIDIAIGGELIYSSDVEFILSNEILLSRLNQYYQINDTRNEEVIETKDNKCYSNYVESRLQQYDESRFRQ